MFDTLHAPVPLPRACYWALLPETRPSIHQQRQGSSKVTCTLLLVAAWHKLEPQRIQNGCFGCVIHQHQHHRGGDAGKST